MKAINSLSMYLLLLCLITSCKHPEVINLNVLVGTWKMESKETYEVWNREGEAYSGYTYKMIEGKKQITETLEIEVIGDAIVYSPTVPNQNDGRAIPFILNRSIKNLFSFENKDHDFPKKIQYKIISDDKIHVGVLGEDDQGFSYFMIRQ